MMDDAERHFQETIGGVPESVAVLRRMAPEAMRSYAETRARLYRPPPEGRLPLDAKELVFIVLDVVAGHVEGACAHAAAGLAAGLRPEQIMEALEICILIHGHHTWARAGMAVMLHVERLTAGRG
jgi:alkylhydroperoxidase/carboxymuconolactone decarboxylase family protein YurZ